MGLDSERLISEVEKRPLLYDGRLKDYHDRVKRRNNWDEVCSAVISTWDRLDEKEKVAKSTEIQSKWKNMKDAFRKDLNLHKKGKLVQASGKQKKKYRHFDQMKFLIPIMFNPEITQNHATAMDQETTQNYTTLKEDGDTQEEASSEDPDPQPMEIPKLTHLNKSNYSNFEQDLVKILTQKVSKDNYYEEEKHFVLSLIPSLKRLNDDQKEWAKIEILKILRRAKYMSQSDTYSTDHE